MLPCLDALNIIRLGEGLELAAYQDSGGVWTVGRGHTPAKPGQRITLAEADRLFLEDVEKAARGVDNLIAVATPNQRGAMISLAYNIGVGAFAGSSICKLHLAARHRQAADAFRLWNKAGGKVLRGLIRRREAERALYLRPEV